MKVVCITCVRNSLKLFTNNQPELFMEGHRTSKRVIFLSQIFSMNQLFDYLTIHTDLVLIQLHDLSDSQVNSQLVWKTIDE